MKHESRRMRRMARSRKKLPGMNLTSLMDVFTILVFFLLTNSATNEVLEPPKVITLPSSVVETKPRETVVVLVTEEDILIQGEIVAKTPQVIESKSIVIEEIKSKLRQEKGKGLGIKTAKNDGVPEVTVLAHKTVPFKLLKKVMSSCTSAGYGKISLAVIQKASQG